MNFFKLSYLYNKEKRVSFRRYIKRSYVAIDLKWVAYNDENNNY